MPDSVPMIAPSPAPRKSNTRSTPFGSPATQPYSRTQQVRLATQMGQNKSIHHSDKKLDWGNQLPRQPTTPFQVQNRNFPQRVDMPLLCGTKKEPISIVDIQTDALPSGGGISNPKNRWQVPRLRRSSIKRQRLGVAANLREVPRIVELPLRRTESSSSFELLRRLRFF